jgi:hypothetical protein
MQLFYAKIPFLLVACNIWTSDTVRDQFPGVMDNRYFTLQYEATPAYSTNAWPFTGKDPGYHGSTESQEYLADVYYKLITETWKIQ